MNPPDEHLRPLQLGLPDLLEKAKSLLDQGFTDDFVRLMLAGRIELNDEQRRVFVNAIQRSSPARSEDCTLTGDFDSLIGVTRSLPITVALSIYPVPSFKYTLTKDVHITIPITIRQQQKQVPLHRLGNLCVATFGTRAQVRMLFPRIHAESGTPKMTQKDCADLYNIGILPAIQSVVPEMRAHWPPSYQAAADLYRDPRGRYHFGSVDVPADSLEEFAHTLHDNLADHPRLGDFYFMIELRGTKGMFSFPFHDAQARHNMFNYLIEHIDLEAENTLNNLNNWYCDVGMEISRPDHVVQWMAAAHHRLLAHALPSKNDDDISRLVEGSNFAVDLSGHLFDLAGFRTSPGSRGRADQVRYVNVYTTDKAVTYQLHQGAFSPHRGSQLYPGTLPRLIKDLAVIARTFSECAGVNGQLQDGTARFEVRVSIQRALHVITTFPDDLLRHSAICIPNTIWWDFKFCRVAAINYVLAELVDDLPESRVQRPSLQLG
ncbi:hypothetical protein ACG7TL_001142 [Trametes sanguinea]